MILKRQFILLVSCLMFLLAGSSIAGDKIKLKLHQPPPNKLGASDLWKLDITNTTNEDITIYLTGTATEEKDGLIVDGKSKVFTVKPGKKTYGYNDFKSGEVNWKNKTSQEAILRTGNVKSGSYTICVTAYYENGSVADNEQCITQVIENKSTGMITLITPGDGEAIDPDTLPGLAFVWTGTGLKGPYTLRIVELKGSQSPDEAMKESAHILIKKEITATNYQYSPGDPKLEKGKKYAWMVKAGETESDVYSFFVSPQGDSINLVITPIPCQGCCFSLSISGNFTSPWNSFKLTSGSNSITSVTPAAGTSVVSQTSGDVVIKQNSGIFTTGSSVGIICFNQVSVPFPVSIMWSTNGGTAFVMPADQQYLQCPAPCPLNDSCHADSVIINTGYNHNNGTIYPNGSFDNYWIVVADPEASTTEPRPANVTGWLSGWNTSLNSVANWINYHPVATNGNDISYDLRYRFCLDSNFQNVQINMKMLVDDEADILVNGNLAASTPLQPFPCGDCNHINVRTFLINNQSWFHSGCNEIIIRVRNVHGVQTGVIVAGSVKATSGLRKISAECCPCTGPTGSINGFKWNDLNGDGIWQSNEPKLPNWTINLSSGQSVQTDAWGYYFFNSLPAGSYTVTETNQSGCTQTFPSGGSHSVQLGYNETISNINFGNKCDSGSSGICDSLNATASAYQGQGNCCWQISLSHPQNTTGIKGIQFLPLSPNTFASASLGVGYTTGWMYQVNNSTEFKIKRVSGYVPPGQLNGFFNFCLNTLSSPQYIVVNWLNASNNVICFDTVTVNCDIPCVTYTKDTIECNGSNYNWIYSFTNNSNFPISDITYTVLSPSGAVVTPGVTILATPVGTGQNSGNITLGLSGVSQNTNVCVVMKFLSADSCCWCYDTLCVTTPSCICDKVDASVTGDPYSCCYNLSLINNYAANYFTQVNFTCMTAGVTISTFSFNGSWGSMNVFPSNQAQVVEGSGYIPLGTSANIGNFCFTGYTTTPQYILVEWIRNDSVKCIDTIITNCVPPEPKRDSCSQIINDTIICLPNGTFQYSFQVQNNSTHTATGFQLNPVSPMGLILTPNNFPSVSILPNTVSAPQSLIISGIGQNTNFCFEIALYEHVGNNYSWCCHGDTVCLTTPICGGGQDTCNCGHMEIDTFSVTENNNIIYSGKCGSTMTSTVNHTYAIGTPLYVCSGNCTPTLSNKVFRNGVLMSSGAGVAYVTPNPAGLWEARYYFYCGGKLCDSCSFFINSKDTPIDSCQVTASMDSVLCGKMVPYGGGTVQSYNFNLTVNSNQAGYLQTPSPYNWYSNSGNTVNTGTNTYSCTFLNTTNLPPGTQVCLTGGVMYMTPVSVDTCFFTVCFLLPDCGGMIGDSCSLQILGSPNQGDTLCKGAPVTINWTGYCPSGLINLSLINVNGWVVYQTIASNIPNTGSYNWTIPSGISCDSVTRWQFYIEDSPRHCWSYGPEFYVKCCDTVQQDSCNCGKWKDKLVHATPKGGQAKTLKCGALYNINIPQNIAFSFPSYICIGQNCNAAYTWKINGPQGPASGTGNSFPYIFSAAGSYNVTVYSYCGNKLCDSCTITVNAKGEGCDCGKWKDKIVKVTPKGGKASKVECGGTYITDIPKNIAFSFPSYICIGQNCTASYQWNINGPQGPASGTGNSFPYIFSTAGTYSVTLYAYCGNKLCDSCTITVNAKGNPDKCECNEKASFIYNPGNGLKAEVKCGETILGAYQQTFTFSPSNLCIPKECAKGYTYEVHDLQTNAYVTGQSMLSMVPFTVTLNSYAGYIITVTYDCNGVKCKCVFYIRTKPIEHGCDCGDWKSTHVGVTINNQPALKYDCGETISANLNANITVNFPSFICKPDTCRAAYTWNLSGSSGNITQGTGNVVNYTFNTAGIYNLSLNAYCGGKLCDSCVIRINIKGSDTCTCNKWNGIAGTITYPTANGNVTSNMNCGGDIPGSSTGNFVFNFNPTCLPPGACNADFKVQFQNAIGTVMQEVTGTSPLTVTVNTSLYYRVKLFSYCDGILCDTCSFTMYVATGYDMKNDRLYGFNPDKNYDRGNISRGYPDLYDKNLFKRMAEIITRWFWKI